MLEAEAVVAAASVFVFSGSDCPGEHFLAGRRLIAVGTLSRNGQDLECLRRDPSPQRDIRSLVERPDRNERTVGAPKPGLVEPAARKPRQPRRLELNPPP